MIQELDKAEFRMLKAKKATDHSDTQKGISILGALFIA